MKIKKSLKIRNRGSSNTSASNRGDNDYNKERVVENLHNCLNMNTVKSRWAPKILTIFDHARRLELSRECLEKSAETNSYCSLTYDIYKFINSILNYCSVEKIGGEPHRSFKLQHVTPKNIARIFSDCAEILLRKGNYKK